MCVTHTNIAKDIVYENTHICGFVDFGVASYFVLLTRSLVTIVPKFHVWLPQHWSCQAAPPSPLNFQSIINCIAEPLQSFRLVDVQAIYHGTVW